MEYGESKALGKVGLVKKAFLSVSPCGMHLQVPFTPFWEFCIPMPETFPEHYYKSGRAIEASTSSM